MTLSPRTTALYSASLAGLLLLSACGKHEPATPTGRPAPTGTAAASSKLAPAPAPAASSTTASKAALPTIKQPVAAASAAATPAPAPISVAKLTLGSAVNAEHQITRPGNRFASDEKTIYASVATEGQSRDATLNATWRYLEGKGQLVSSISQSIATDGPAITTFKVQNPDLWPEGKYSVEISLNGKPVAQQGFEISRR
ncbi:MAG: hypothetical protein KGJ32_09140 [Xanthomonadaceae bacterium]|nr:hypothetical protein [Xanthomonadaceae bacterium]